MTTCRRCGEACTENRPGYEQDDGTVQHPFTTCGQPYETRRGTMATTMISSYRDIETWVENASPANVAQAGLGQAVAHAIQAADHPPYGTDWSDWLAENGERIAIDATT